MTSIFLTLALWIQGGPIDPTSEAKQELLRIACAGHVSSINMIDSYYASVKLTNTSPRARGQSFVEVTEYWRTSELTRLHTVMYQGKVVDAVIQEGRLAQIESSSGPAPPKPASGIIMASVNRRVVDSDAWELSLFCLPVGVFTKPPIQIYSLEEATKLGSVPLLERQTHNGVTEVHMIIIVPPARLDNQSMPRRYELWLDQSHNWLVRKAIHTLENEDGSPDWEVSAEVTAFLEIAPTLYVPSSCALTKKYKGDVITTATVAFTNVKVNEGLPEAPAMPIAPNGSLVVNEVDGTVYRADARGKAIGQARHVIADYSPPVSVDPTLPKNNLWTLVGWLSLIVAALFIVASLFLRRRRARPA
jgi:hypothetical protein